MKARQYAVIMTMIGSGLLIMSCLLPGMIPLMPARTIHAPIMEQNVDTLIETLNGPEWVAKELGVITLIKTQLTGPGPDWVPLEWLAEEWFWYMDADYAKPGKLTFTINITDNTPTYFYYGWCTTTQEILRQNFEHISVKLYFNDEELGSDVVHPIAYTSFDDLVCVEFGVLISEWPNGKYTLKTVSTFNEKINDGVADYEAGDYIYIYNVTVEK